MNDVVDASYEEVSGANVPAIADDNLMRVAEMAEKRIDAVVKIKQMALKVTNARRFPLPDHRLISAAYSSTGAG